MKKSKTMSTKSAELMMRQATMQSGLMKKKTFAVGSNPDDMMYATMRTVVTRQTTTVDDKTGEVLNQQVE